MNPLPTVPEPAALSEGAAGTMDAVESPPCGILTKSARVIVIDASNQIRHLACDVIRSMGFAKVQGVTSCKDTLRLLEVESSDWVIAPLQAGEEINALHLLHLRSTRPELKTISISLLLDSTEAYVLPLAFSMGLISFHPKATSRDVFSDEINALMQRLAQFDGNQTLLAGSYFRPWVRSINKPDLLLKVDDAMCRHVPSESTLLANLAESLYANNRKPEAHRLIAQVQALDPASADLCEQFRSQNPLDKVDDNSGPDASQAANVLGVKNVMVVDGDSVSQTMISSKLLGVGVPTVVSFNDGSAAREWLSKNEPDLVIMEWRIPKISGPMLIQDIRSRGFYNTPITVVSSLVGKADLPLLREMGVTNVITKPLNESSLLKGIIESVQVLRQPTNGASAEIKIRAHLNSGKILQAEQVWAAHQHDFAEATKLELLGSFAYEKKDFQLAAKNALAALQLRPDAIFALNLLGKSLLRLSDYALALKCFEKAQAISPQNIERLCNISKAHHALGNEKEAGEAMDAAKKLDQGAQAVHENTAIDAIEAGDAPLAAQVMKGISQLTNMVAYLNNQAVALARAGRIDDGIELYRRTLDAIPEDREEVTGIVSYNLALAYVRGKRPIKEAIEFAKVAAAKASPEVRERAKSLAKRLATPGAMKSSNLSRTADQSSAAADNAGMEDPAAENPAAAKGGEPLHASIAQLVLSKPGDMGLHMIFTQADSEIDQRARALIASVPRFARRTGVDGTAPGAKKQTA